VASLHALLARKTGPLIVYCGELVWQQRFGCKQHLWVLVLSAGASMVRWFSYKIPCKKIVALTLCFYLFKQGNSHAF
jgi:hypothetical protein